MQGAGLPAGGYFGVRKRVTNGFKGIKRMVKRGACIVMENSAKKKSTLYEAAWDMEYTRADGALAVSLLAVGFLFWELVSLFRPGAGTVIFTGIVCSVSVIYLNHKGYRQNKRSLIGLVVIVLSSAVFLIFDGYLEKQLNLLFIMAAFVQWIALTTGSTIENRLSGYSLIDLLYQSFARGLGNLPCLPSILAKHIKQKKAGKGTAAALLGILIMIPILCAVIMLLVRADPAFDHWMGSIKKAVSDEFLIYVWYFVLGIPVACYLCGLIRGSVEKHPSAMEKTKVDRAFERIRIAPAAAVCSSLAALNLVYVIFFLAQTSYLFSAFRQILPEHMTYAEYARHGFFELCAVTAINLAVIFAAKLLSQEGRGKLLRIEVILLSVFTLALTVIDLSKMVLYIQSYGLTRLRIYTSIFMIFLFIVFLIILLRQVRPFQAGRAVILAALICFFGLCYGNVDGQIAKYNMGQYLAGNLELMDRASMEALSDGAVPYFFKAYREASDEEDAQLLYAVITGDSAGSMAQVPEKEDIKTFNLQQYRAQKIRKEIKPPAGTGGRQLLF